ncbi:MULTISPECIES: thioesterase family protein [unclassified Marinobacterium]|jgi:acyl-CoA thioester hydrolase|uniref:acyl-CoA thioesterase n=1 Tax=unclassified Marinobacterium TaxID=2644139 RepID=UPI00156904E1|nr:MULTISPECIES: thioesterase family protein [unclassified Marinobacterium]NRP37056.1 Acyl-ACP thioesterase [Marinobacterium sp. xm-d-579]NRP47132.1 Acyl-ACP thioesterase [Marinobacterium sp. xm-d-543]NRQ22903.1 Acyl-ACP thioesterase [Marinobacterium sp. xm-m-312]
MARIKIDMPDNYLFSTVMDVRISDINYGNHLGNDSVLSFVHEARTRFFRQYGYTEMDVEGLGIIMTDSAIVYKAEGFHGDQIQIDITVGDFNKYGCDIFYLMTNKATAVEIAHVKTGIVFFDYDARKVVTLPEQFRANLMKEA